MSKYIILDSNLILSLNGYQLQIRRKRRGRLCVVDPWVRDESAEISA